MELVQQPSGLGWALVAVLLSWVSITTITIVLRFYVQLRMLKRPAGWEECFAGVGWILFLVYAGIAIASAFYGIGHHLFPMPPPGFWMTLKLTYFHDLVFLLSNMAVKQSIAFSLLRYVVEDYHKKLIHAVTFVVQICSIVLFFTSLYYCIPIEFFWTQARGATHGMCSNKMRTTRIAYAYSASFVLYDLVMAILPWFMVRKLQLDMRTKLMIAILLAFGSITFVATIVRIPFIVATGRSEDFTYETAKVTIVSSCEAGLSIATSSAAMLKPLFRKTSSRTGSAKGYSKTPKLNTIPVTSDGSCSSAGTTKQGDIEFSTEFYGSNR